MNVIEAIMNLIKWIRIKSGFVAVTVINISIQSVNNCQMNK